MKLYGYWRSSCSYRVRIALAYKGVAYDASPVHLVRDGGQQHAEGFAAHNAMRQVPVLAVETPTGRVAELAQSVAILEYLEETFPAPPLLPADPILRARTRQLTEIVNAGIQPLQNLRVLQELERDYDADVKAWCVRHIARGLLAYQATAETISGKLSVGDQLSFADCALIPQLYNARRFGIDVEAQLPLLHAIDQHAQAIEAVAAAHPDRQPDAESETAS